jgi:hypothetical protein
MSDSEWELATSTPEQSQAQPSEWEVATNPETFGQALKNAPGRIIGDIGEAAMRGFNSLPGYWEKAKTEIPGLLNPVGQMRQHPFHAAGQALAGGNELINAIAQFPLNVSRYGSERLNLTPQALTNALAKITPEDTTQAINQLFGEPKYPGEAAIRGTVRNLPAIAGATKLASMVKPTQLFTTKKAIKNEILNAHDALDNRATTAFNDVSSQVNKRGIGQLPTGSMPNVDFETMRGYFPSIKKYDKLLTGAEYGDYNSLRKLQTDLYSEGKKNLGSSTEADRMKGAEMLEKRDEINQAIQKHLVDTGNNDLAEKLQGARNDWRTLQQTYYNENMNNAIVNMVNKDFRKVPKNLIEVLDEESLPMKNLLNFHPGLETRIGRYKTGQNILGKSLKYGLPAGAAYLGYEYGKGK